MKITGEETVQLTRISTLRKKNGLTVPILVLSPEKMGNMTKQYGYGKPATIAQRQMQRFTGNGSSEHSSSLDLVGVKNMLFESLISKVIKTVI